MGVLRRLPTGTHDESAWPENADAAWDQVPIPTEEIETDLGMFQGGPAMVLPWWDATENPTAGTGLYSSNDPHYPHQDVGGRGIVGAYEPAVRTRGPVYQFGHEPSGGLTGDQALGRIMRFPANVPDRFDPDAEGVWQGDYRDELAAAIASSGQGVVTETEYIGSLLMYDGPPETKRRRR